MTNKILLKFSKAIVHFSFMAAGIFSCIMAMDIQVPNIAHAQDYTIPAPDRDFVFMEDKYKKKNDRAKKEAIKAKRKAAAESAKKIEGVPFDLNAKNISYDSATSSIIAQGDVIISHASGILEADKAEYNVETEEATLKNGVRLTEVASTVTADEASVNFSTGMADLSNANIYLEEGDYRLNASKAKKVGEQTFTMQNAELTTCHCPEGDEVCPWKIRAKDAEITKEGYGEVWNATLMMRDVPVFYTPYLIFPAKTERQSGLLPPSFGFTRHSAFTYQQPVYVVLDESSDTTLSPLYESDVRTGVESEYRQIFTDQNVVQGGFNYMNESWRNGRLLGTNISGLSDPSLSTNRFSGYMMQVYKTEIYDQPVQYVMDGKYVSDDLILREFDYADIGESNARYVTSRASLRGSFLDRYSAELSGEFNQAMVDNDDYVLQQLPQASLKATNSLNAFGDNPLGAKLLFSSSLTTTDYVRTQGYDGNKSELYEKVSLPFHFANYLENEFAVEGRATSYSLSDTEVIDSSTGEQTGELPDTSDRAIPAFSYKTGTTLENVYQVDKDSIFKQVADLGASARSQELVRTKHTLEPYIKYRYVPYVDQSETPQFDSYDRMSRKNLVTYGLTQRLYGKFEPLNEYLYGVEEIAPEPTDLGYLTSTGVLNEKYSFGLNDTKNGASYTASRGQVRELARLGVYQSFDVQNELNKSSEDTSDDTSFSDLGVTSLLLPNDHVSLQTTTNFDAQDAQFSSYKVEGAVNDKRGDEIRSRLNFVDGYYRQLENSLEVQLISNLKLGYYTRYDDMKGEFLEQKAALRISSSCNCWIFDIGVSDKLNPDETKVMFNLNLLGLGEFGKSFNASQQSSSQD